MGSGVGVCLPERHVRRARLVSQLLGAPVAVLEAGAGYGKSVLAAEYLAVAAIASVVVSLGARDDNAAVLAWSLRRSFSAVAPASHASPTAGADPGNQLDELLDQLAEITAPLVVVLEDAHCLKSAEAAALVVRLARGLPGQHRLLVTARRLPASLEPAAAIGGARRLDSSALAFTQDEISELALNWIGPGFGRPDAKELLRVTDGWPAAIFAAMTMIASAAGAGGAGRCPLAASDLLLPLLGPVFETLSEHDRAWVARLSHLPWLSPELVDDVTGVSGMFDRLIGAGIPFIRTALRRWELPCQLRMALRARSEPEPGACSAAGQAYARAGDVLGTERVLLTGGLTEQAATVLADLSPGVAGALGWARLNDLVEALPPAAVARQPRVLLHLARAAETVWQPEARRSALARALSIAKDEHCQRDGSLLREIIAEQARDLLEDSRTRCRAAALARSVLDHADRDEVAARARALEVLGRLGCSWFSQAGPQAEAESLLTEAVRLAGQVSQQTWVAQASLSLAMGLHYPACRYGSALAVLDQALAELEPNDLYLALLLTARSHLLGELGRDAEAGSGLEQARAVARALRVDWVTAMTWRCEALLASFAGDHDRTIRAVLRSEARGYEWCDRAYGAELLAGVVDALDRVGEHALARRRLATAREQAAGHERVLTVAQAAILGRSGDPARADQAIAAALARTDISAHERWPLLLLRAYAASRRGDRDTGSLAAEAFEHCWALGHPDGPLFRERGAAEALLPVAAQAGSAVASGLLERAGRLSIRLLGGFEVWRGGVRVELPVGQPALAVRVTAAVGGRVPAEELIEVLWPGTEPEAGRNRLRNLLSRLRVAGEILTRQGSLIAIRPGCQVDAADFAAQAEQVLSVRLAQFGHREADLARLALGRYRGDFLPDDQYESWAIGPRERLRVLRLHLLDLVAADAEANGEIDEAVRRTQEAIDAEPGDEFRYVRLVRLLAGSGRIGSARGVFRQARSMLRELDIEPSPELVDAERLLGVYVAR